MTHFVIMITLCNGGNVEAPFDKDIEIVKNRIRFAKVLEIICGLSPHRNES